MYGEILALLFIALAVWVATEQRMSAHQEPADESYADWIRNPDPSPGNTTAGGVYLPQSFTSIYRLIATQAVTQEERNLADPPKAGLMLGLYFFSTAGANLRVVAATRVNYASAVNITFTAAHQYVLLQSVPYGVGTVNFRWQVISNDGATIN